LQSKRQQFGALPTAHYEEGAVWRTGYTGRCGATWHDQAANRACGYVLLIPMPIPIPIQKLHTL